MTLAEKLAEIFGFGNKETDLAKLLREAERLQLQLQEIRRGLEYRTVQQLCGGGNYDLTNGLMTDKEIESKIERYLIKERSYELRRF